MKNTIKARIPLTTLIFIISIIGGILSIGGVALAMYNWDNIYPEVYAFPVNKTSVMKNWQPLKGNAEVQTLQLEGVKTKYSLLVKKRWASSWSAIFRNVNLTTDKASKVYKHQFGAWLDYRFKIEKQNKTGYYSEVFLMVEVKK